MKAASPWLAVAACAGWLYHSRPDGADWAANQLPFFVLIVICDLLYALGGPHRFSRVAPTVALSGLWLGQWCALGCLIALFGGTLLLLLTSSPQPRAIEAAGRGLLPFAVAPLFLTGPASEFAQLLFAVQAYFVTALLLGPKDSRFRMDLLLLIAAPGISLGLVSVFREEPRLTILMLPLLVALSCTREDNSMLMAKLRKLMGLAHSKDDQIKFLIRSSQELLQVRDPEKLRELLGARAAEAPRPELYELFQQLGRTALGTARQQKELAQALQEQAEQTRRLQGLLGAAQLMTSTLEAAQLERALHQSLQTLTAPQRLDWVGPNFAQPALLKKAREKGQPVKCEGAWVFPYPGFLIESSQPEVVEILVRIYLTCRQNVDTLKELKESQAQLLESNRMAAVGRLAAGVAHELNTPLGAISLSAEHGQRLLGRGQLEKAATNFQTILEASQMSQLTVARLRAYTRPKSESTPASKLNPLKVIEDALKLLQSRIESSEVELSRDFETDLWITVIPIDFYGIVNNLLVNALDSVGSANPPRKLHLSLKAVGAGVLFQVDDNGPGVPAEHSIRIFEAFFTTKDEGRGMGLGLHLCRQFAEQAGGSIELATAALGGASFRVWLPASPN